MEWRRDCILFLISTTIYAYTEFLEKEKEAKISKNGRDKILQRILFSNCDSCLRTAISADSIRDRESETLGDGMCSCFYLRLSKHLLGGLGTRLADEVADMIVRIKRGLSTCCYSQPPEPPGTQND